MGKVKVGNDVVNQEGRVLCVTAIVDSREDAMKIAYDDVLKIKADPCFYHTDSGSAL